MPSQDPTPRNWGFPGTGVAKNVAGAVGGAVGGAFGGKAGGTAPSGFEAINIQPLYPTGGSSSSGAVKSAPPKPPTGMGIGSLFSQSPQRNGWTDILGSRSTINASARATNGLNSSSGKLLNPGGRPRGMPGPRVQQAAVNRSVAAPRSAEATAADPNNWAGIARDLGNAGSPGFARYKTGGYASSAAQAYVKKSNQAAVEAPPGASPTARAMPFYEAPPGASPTARAKPAKNPGGWKRSEGGPRARAAAAKKAPLIGKGPR